MTDKQLTEVSDLLKPRYKVIADYPGSIFKVGEIFFEGINEGRIYCDEKSPKYSDYPHLFKKLEWWEERKPEEMPEYVKYAASGEVRKVVRFDLETTSAWFMYLDGEFAPYCPGGSSLDNTHWLPSTKEEYESFINQNKQS